MKFSFRLITLAIVVLSPNIGHTVIHYVHPDCGFWMLPRSVADGKMVSLVAGRNRFLGQKVEV